MLAIWNALQQAPVRDLAWSLFSPPLMQYLPGGQSIALDRRTAGERDRQWLQCLDADPQALLQHLRDRPSRRLGIYFENLVAFFFRSPLCRQRDGLVLRAQNLQVRRRGKTLGEFDFLFSGSGGAAAVHTETAVKFYLGTPAPAGRAAATASGAAASDWAQWLGPNCRDRLDIKLTHLLQRQLQLARQAAAQPLLSPLHIDPAHLTRRLFLRGVLLYPGHCRMAPPAGADCAHIRGSWHYLRDFLERSADADWELLPRLQWLAPTAAASLQTHSGAALRRLLNSHFAAHRQPLMLRAWESGRARGSGDAPLHMVVPDYWPRTT